MSETNFKISLELVDKAAQKALDDFISKSDKADKNLDKLKDTGKGTFNEIAVSIGKSAGIYDIFVGNLAANVAIKAFELMASAANTLFQTFIVDGVHAAQEQEKANNDLNVALAQTGIYSAKTAEEFQKLASDIQSATGISDDAILTNAALIQSLGQLDKDGLKRATSAAVDLSAALGKDLGSVSEALGKAAAGNTTAIQKMGISFQKSADDGETFNNILKALEDRFGGAAVSKVNTFAGAVSLTKATFGELQESVGNVIVQNAVVVEVLKSVGKVITDLTTDVDGSNSSFKRMVGEGLILAIDGFMVLSAVTDSVVRVFTAGVRLMETVLLGLATVSTKILSYFVKDMEGIAQATQAAAIATAKSVGSAFTEDTGLGKATQMLATLREGALKGMDALKNGATSAKDPLEGVAGSINKVSAEQTRANEELQKWALNLGNATKDNEAQFQAQLQTLALQKEEQLVVNNDYLNRNAELELSFLENKKLAEDQYYQDQQLRLAMALDKELITRSEYDAAKKTLRDKAELAERKSDIELTKFKNDQEKTRAENLKGSLGYISSLQQSSVKEFFFIGKAAALATAYIDAQAAVTKALASAPPPYNFALAAAVGVAAGVNIAKIASASPPAFEDGGIVGGSSFSGDKVSARVNSGEMILNRSQQKELFAIANGKSGSGNLDSKIDALLNILAGKDDRIVVNIGGKTIVDSLRSELSAGRSFA